MCSWARYFKGHYLVWAFTTWGLWLVFVFVAIIFHFNVEIKLKTWLWAFECVNALWIWVARLHISCVFEFGHFWEHDTVQMTKRSRPKRSSRSMLCKTRQKRSFDDVMERLVPAPTNAWSWHIGGSTLNSCRSSRILSITETFSQWWSGKQGNV